MITHKFIYIFCCNPKKKIDNIGGESRNAERKRKGHKESITSIYSGNAEWFRKFYNYKKNSGGTYEINPQSIDRLIVQRMRTNIFHQTALWRSPFSLQSHGLPSWREKSTEHFRWFCVSVPPFWFCEISHQSVVHASRIVSVMANSQWSRTPTTRL